MTVLLRSVTRRSMGSRIRNTSLVRLKRCGGKIGRTKTATRKELNTKASDPAKEPNPIAPRGEVGSDVETLGGHISDPPSDATGYTDEGTPRAMT